MTDRTTPDTRPLQAGDPSVLGAYEILGRLGEGGQGTVFLGRGPNGHVAVKLMHSGLATDDPARARFVRELDVAKRVARFCTAQVLDADLAGDRPYIVSEFVTGQSLHRLVQAEGPRTGGALERLAISTLTALYAIHQAGIVHRDFKPHNVMMGPDGPRVIDFGVARALNAAGETQNVGTPAYMAPEHFTGAPMGPAADLFAWGTTMVFAATGAPAFGNDDMAAVMHRIITLDPDLRELPSPLREVVSACLAKDPGQRPTAKEAQERLVGAAPLPFPGAHAVRGTTEPQPFPERRRGRGRLVIPIIAAAAVAALLAGGTVWAATRSGGDDGPAAPAGESPTGIAQEGIPGSSDNAEQLPSPKPPSGKSNRPTSSQSPGQQPQPSPRPTSPAPEPANKYTPVQVCNSGGHGKAFYVQRSMAVPTGRAYQLYNKNTGYNCAVMLKSKNVGRPSTVGVWIQAQGGNQVKDSGSFAWYAGPVFVHAPGKCVRFGSGSKVASYANCG